MRTWRIDSDEKLERVKDTKRNSKVKRMIFSKNFFDVLVFKNSSLPKHTLCDDCATSEKWEDRGGKWTKREYGHSKWALFRSLQFDQRFLSALLYSSNWGSNF